MSTGTRFNTQIRILHIQHKDDIDRYDHGFLHRGVYLSDDYIAKTSWFGTMLDGYGNPAKVCPVTAVAPVWRATIRPRDASDLALMANVSVDALPDVLQHWVDVEHDAGNHLLDRIDPLDWVVRNPWRKIDFNVVSWLSQSGFKKLAKSAGAPAIDRFRTKA